MKILQINKYFYQKGGAETVFFNTMNLLKENGHAVIPFALKLKKNLSSDYERFFVEYPELSESGVLTKIKKIPSFLYNQKAAKQLERLILEEKPDVAHIHLMFNSMSVSILPVLKKYNIPVVMTAHDYRLVCPAYAITDGKGNVCERCFDGRSYWHCITNKCSHGNLLNSILLSADSYLRKYVYDPIDYISKFIFVSNFSRAKHIQGDVRLGKTSTQLYNFTPIEKSKEQLEKEDYILFVGRISEEKGLRTLLKAVDESPEVNLKMIGVGPLLDELKKHESPRIEFLGFRQGDELRDYIQKARYLVLSSECYENNPMVIIEAMTLGTPVIGSCIGGIPELIEDGKTGFLFETKNVEDLKQTIRKARNVVGKEYQDMCDLAEKVAKNKFSKEVHYAKLMGIYESVLAKRNAQINKN